MKKFFSLFLSLIMIFTLALPAFATNSNSINIMEAPADFGAPISEVTYYDEELDATVTERTYFVPNPNTAEKSVVPYNDSKGEGWYKKEKTHQWAGSGNTTTIFAKGYFSWANGDVSVTSPSGGYDYFPSEFKNVTNNVTSGTGRYGLIFNKYAYVTYTVNYTNNMGNVRDLSVTIRISESGNDI